MSLLSFRAGAELFVHLCSFNMLPHHRHGKELKSKDGQYLASAAIK